MNSKHEIESVYTYVRSNFFYSPSNLKFLFVKLVDRRTHKERKRAANNRYLTPFEIQKLHGWCLGFIATSLDHTISDEVMRQLCKDILQERGVTLGTANGLPGMKWLRNFKASADIYKPVQKGVQRTAGKRLAASTAAVRAQHFKDIEYILMAHNIVAIRNFDETTVGSQSAATKMEGRELKGFVTGKYSTPTFPKANFGSGNTSLFTGIGVDIDNVQSDKIVAARNSLQFLFSLVRNLFQFLLAKMRSCLQRCIWQARRVEV